MENFKCEVCTQSFTTKQGLERHVLRKMNRFSPTFLKRTCGLCNFEFTRQQHFRRHEKTNKHRSKVSRNKLVCCVYTIAPPLPPLHYLTICIRARICTIIKKHI